MPPVRNRSRRNSALGTQNQYGDDPAAAFADLFGAPEDAADFDVPPGAYEGGNHPQSDDESTSSAPDATAPTAIGNRLARLRENFNATSVRKASKADDIRIHQELGC